MVDLLAPIETEALELEDVSSVVRKEVEFTGDRHKNIYRQIEEQLELISKKLPTKEE